MLHVQRRRATVDLGLHAIEPIAYELGVSRLPREELLEQRLDAASLPLACSGQSSS